MNYIFWSLFIVQKWEKNPCEAYFSIGDTNKKVDMQQRFLLKPDVGNCANYKVRFIENKTKFCKNSW